MKISNRLVRACIGVGALAVLVSAVLAQASAAPSSTGSPKTYIVFLDTAGSPETVTRTAQDHARRHGGTIRHVFRALGGYSIDLPAGSAASKSIAHEVGVALVAPDVVHRNSLAGHTEVPASPRTTVWLSVSPNPSYPNQVVTFQWVANGFPGPATCNDNVGWVVNGPGNGSVQKVAGVDFTTSFQWRVECTYDDFFADQTIVVTYNPTPPPPPPPPPGQCVDPPYNLSPPTISGSVVPGSTLTGYAGDWDFDGSVCISRYSVAWQKFTLAGVFMGNMKLIDLFPPNKTDTLTLAVSDTGYKYRLSVTARGPQGFERYQTTAYSAFTSPVYCTGSSQSIPTGVDRIEADLSGTVSGNCSSILPNTPEVIAVIDSGIAAHPDLNVVTRVSCTNAPAEGDHAPSDFPAGHGTPVAGLIGAKDNGAGIVGVAPGWPLRSVKTANVDGSDSEEAVICGIDDASYTRIDGLKGNDVSVANISASYGGADDDSNCGLSNQDALHQAVCRARDRGLVIVASAGNDGRNYAGQNCNFPPCPKRPALYDEVLTATAMADYNGTGRWVGGIPPTCDLPNGDGSPDDRYAGLSNFALFSADRNHTVAGPGNCVLSTDRSGGYSLFGGTSAAAPHAAGVVGLCQAQQPPAGCKGLSPGQVVSTIINQAYNYGVAHPDHRFVGDGFSTQNQHYFGYLVEADTH